MGSESYHEPLDRLSEKTQNLHRGIVSLMEELEAIDWYQQRADACSDEELKRVLLHNKNEEVEHACMVLEWIRRNDEHFDTQLRGVLFREGSIAEAEEQAKQELSGDGGGAAVPKPDGSLGIGSLKGGI